MLACTGVAARWRSIHEELLAHLQDPRAGIARYVEALLDEAVRVRASDVHLQASGLYLDEPRAVLRIRIRIDGRLHPLAQFYGSDAMHVLSRVKLIAGMELGRPKHQQGRLTYEPRNPNLQIRATAAPTADGEHVALRLFAHDLLQRSLDEIGLEAEDRERLEEILAGEAGLVLVAGPSGSGKTSTIHAIARSEFLAGSNIVTIEDPVEARLEIATQIGLAGGETFEGVMRSVIRLDADAIVAGEIRDVDSARAAVQAATGGRFVFSTMHARRAHEAVDGLLRRGVSGYDAAAALRGIIAQRLVRRICPCCLERIRADAGAEARLAEHGLDALGVSRGRGCGACYGTGYLGRTGVFEVVAIDSQLRQALFSGADAESVRAIVAERGWSSLPVAAWRKVAQGVTTVEEVRGLHVE